LLGNDIYAYIIINDLVIHMDEKIQNALNFIQTNTNKHKRIATINSFGKDSIVTQWLVNQVKPDLPVLWVIPPFLPKETITFAEQIIKDWNLNIIRIKSDKLQDQQFMENIFYKPKLWKTQPETCCVLMKDEPMFRMVREMKLQAWFSGLRATESEKRSMFTGEWKQGEFVKLHPILDWTEADVWRITAAFKLPVHPWYGEGYRSLGCSHCSFPNVWYAERGGRWKDTLMESLGCGLHCLPPYLTGEKEMVEEVKKKHRE